MKYLPTIAFVCVLLTTKAYISEAPIVKRDMSVKGMIVYHAKAQGVNEEQMLKVSFCESSYKQNAVGDGGKALGVFQYHKPTFDRYASWMGEKLDYTSAEDQIKLTAWIWKNHPEEKRAWTCYTKMVK